MVTGILSLGNLWINLLKIVKKNKKKITQSITCLRKNNKNFKKSPASF